jgi:5-methylthioadenosine/S-adenosylhomocysteine deaminase
VNRSYVLPLPRPSSILIKDASYVLTEDGPRNDLSLFVRDRRIVALAEDANSLTLQFGAAEEVIDARKLLVIPGFVNNHTHLAMTLLRGYAEDLPLMSWLSEKIWPAEARLEPDDIYLGAVAGAAEALLSGTTTLNSAYFYNTGGSEAEALLDVGPRAVVAHGFFDWTSEGSFARAGEMIFKYHGADEARIRCAVGPHSPYSCSPGLLKDIESFRARIEGEAGNGFPMLNEIHVAEAGEEAREVERKYGVTVRKGVLSYLDTLGVLNERTVAADCIHLTEEDVAALKSSRASVASCPISNLKVGMGVANLPRLISNGVTVSLGTDGPASNNTLDMFETAKMASLLPKGLQNDTTLMNSRQTFEIATLGGATSLGQRSEIGSIAPGKRADIVTVNLSNAHSFPFYEPYSHLIFTARAHDVRDVIVDGRLLVRNRRLLTVDIDELQKRIDERVLALGLKRARTHCCC